MWEVPSHSKKRELQDQFVEDYKAYFTQYQATKPLFDVFAIVKPVYVQLYDLNTKTVRICWDYTGQTCLAGLSSNFGYVPATPSAFIQIDLGKINSFVIVPSEESARRVEGMLTGDRVRRRMAIIYAKLFDSDKTNASHRIHARIVQVDIVDIDPFKVKQEASQLLRARVLYIVAF